MRLEDSYWNRYWAGRTAGRQSARAAARRRRPRLLDGRQDGLNYWQRRQRRRG